MKEENKTLKQLKIFYLFVFALGTIIIAPTHIFSPPTFMYARFPHYLEMMGPFWGVSWPMSFEIYHYVLYVIIAIISLNTLGILFYPKFKNIAITSSLIGIFIFFITVLFFFFLFSHVNISTSIVYGIYFVTLLIVNYLTFKTLARGKKEA